MCGGFFFVFVFYSVEPTEDCSSPSFLSSILFSSCFLSLYFIFSLLVLSLVFCMVYRGLPLANSPGARGKCRKPQINRPCWSPPRKGILPNCCRSTVREKSWQRSLPRASVIWELLQSAVIAPHPLMMRVGVGRALHWLFHIKVPLDWCNVVTGAAYGRALGRASGQVSSGLGRQMDDSRNE